MRAECTLVIDPTELYDAIYFLSNVSRDVGEITPSCVALRPMSDGVLVVSECGEVEISGTGHWRQRIGVDGWELAVLAHKFLENGCLRLLFTGSRLLLNSTSIRAWYEPMPIRLEPVTQGWQQLLPGFEPVSEADRLQYRVNQPLRPRVGQHSLVGTALFGK